MGVGNGNGRIWLFGSVLAIALPALAPSGQAATEHNPTPSHKVVHATQHVQVAHRIVTPSANHTVARDERHYVSRAARATVRFAVAHGYASRGYTHYTGISCVPYARAATGITVAGNAWQWWDNSAGTYQHGDVPEPGGVLAFRANGRMRLGHVAVVAKVVNSREIEIDQANWAGGGITRGVPVVDVSENNDWTAVRVGLGRSDSFGSIYPTYGFIYDRPDTGAVLTAITAPAVQPALNEAPADLRALPGRTVVASARRKTQKYDEVAEAPLHPRPRHGGTHLIDRAEAATR
jgi:surface antigen